MIIKMAVSLGLITPSNWLLILTGVIIFSVVLIIANWMVLRGLRLEGKPEKDDSPSIEEYRARKANENKGWLLLMCGIRLELIAGAALAIFGIVEYVKTADEIAKNDPLNRPISEISAIVDFKVKEDNPSETPNWGMPRVAGLILCETNLVLGNVFQGFSQLSPLESDKFDRYFDGKTLEYVLQFHLEGVGAIFMRNNTKTAEWALENVRFLDITTKFLPHDAEVLGGSVVLTINSGPQKWFLIPAQKDLDPNSGKFGYGYQVIASVPPAKRGVASNVVETPKN